MALFNQTIYTIIYFRYGKKQIFAQNIQNYFTLQQLHRSCRLQIMQFGDQDDLFPNNIFK